MIIFLYGIIFYAVINIKFEFQELPLSKISLSIISSQPL